MFFGWQRNKYHIRFYCLGTNTGSVALGDDFNWGLADPAPVSRLLLPAILFFQNVNVHISYGIGNQVAGE